MNERIRELYRQAHSIRHHDDDPTLEGNPPTVYWQGEVSAKRFAELIVRECAGVAYEYDAPKMSGPGMIIAGMIETHFGVEE